MASWWKSLAKFGLPIVGGMFGGPAGAAVGGGIGGALGGGGFKGAAIGAGTGYLGGKLFGGGMGNPLKSGGVSASTLRQGQHMMAGGQGTAGYGMGQQLLKGGGGGGFSKLFAGGGGVGLKSNPLLTGGALMLGSQMLGSPSVPELPQSVRDYQSAARQGNPLQNQAAGVLSQQLGQSMEGLTADEEAKITRSLDQSKGDEMRQLEALYHSARPGTDYINDYSYQRDASRINDRYATLRADSLSGARRQIRNDFAVQKGQQIAQARGLSSEQLQQLSTLSEYDLDRVLDQWTTDYNDKKALRDYILKLGGNVAMSGFGMNPFGGYGGQYGQQ